MASRKKELVDAAPISKQAALLARLRENSPCVSSASQLQASWRYIDFVNPTAKLPCISLEWVFGARGLLAGRVMQLRATYSKGKSSFMYLEYAAAQLMSGAFCLHVETEGAASPSDYIASFGCNPNDLMMAEISSLEECLAKVDEVICEVRGGFGGSVNAEGRQIKSKYTDPIDPKCESPIVIGIDSLSSLGSETAVNADIADVSGTPQLSYHTRKLREYFRDRVGRLRDSQTLLMLTSHETAVINTGKKSFGSKGGDSKTSLAQEAIGIHGTYGVDVSSVPYWDKEKGVEIGSKITLFTFKNKLSPRHRGLDLYMVTGSGFDLIKTDYEFLTSHAASPFAVAPGEDKMLYAHAHGITCKPLSDKPFKTQEEFLRALYGNTDFVMSLREKMRIRGCGFEFETKYQLPPEDGVAEEDKE